MGNIMKLWRLQDGRQIILPQGLTSAEVLKSIILSLLSIQCKLNTAATAKSNQT